MTTTKTLTHTHKSAFSGKILFRKSKNGNDVNEDIHLVGDIRSQ